MQIDATVIFNQVDNKCLDLKVFMECTQVQTGAEGIAQASYSVEHHALQGCQ